MSSPATMSFRVRLLIAGGIVGGIALLLILLDASRRDGEAEPRPFREREAPRSTAEDRSEPSPIPEDAEPNVGEMFVHIRDFIERWLPNFEQENRSYITVAVGCTGGRHRSVYMVESLRRHFGGKRIHVQVWHRELSLSQ